MTMMVDSPIHHEIHLAGADIEAVMIGDDTA